MSNLWTHLSTHFVHYFPALVNIFDMDKLEDVSIFTPVNRTTFRGQWKSHADTVDAEMDVINPDTNRRARMDVSCITWRRIGSDAFEFKLPSIHAFVPESGTRIQLVKKHGKTRVTLLCTIDSVVTNVENEKGKRASKVCGVAMLTLINCTVQSGTWIHTVF